MITIKNITKSIFGEPLFEDVSLVLRKGDKIGLVGPNGCGKSTLIKIILGEIESDKGRVLIENERIGYLPQDLSMYEDDNLSKLSGGQKTKFILNKILESKPTVLLLDEPTNHLDWKNLEWLEGVIRDFKGAVLIVSHDRRLLDNSVNKVLEIDATNHKFNEYTGGYTEYMMEKEKKMAIWEEDYKLQQNEKRRMELWLALKRQEAHVHPDPAKGRQIRAMEKRMQREIFDQEIKRPRGQKKINVELRGETASPKLVLGVKEVSKNFPNKRVLYKISFDIRGKEHVLLAGDNGSGKTTLLKIITGNLAADSGEVKYGEKVRFGYFAQEHENLDLNKSVLDEFLSTDALAASRNPRAVLGAFLFSAQNVFKKVSSLSLGERVRLIFAKLTNQENEFLILDEPTNHLDIQSREVIEDALMDYKGAILVVSHDRYFLDKILINKSITLEEGMAKERLN